MRIQSETEKHLRLKLHELSPAGVDVRVGLDDDIIALCHVVDERFSVLLDACKRLQSRLHAIETREHME
jgi:hypothetical protein